MESVLNIDKINCLSKLPTFFNELGSGVKTKLAKLEHGVTGLQSHLECDP